MRKLIMESKNMWNGKKEEDNLTGKMKYEIISRNKLNFLKYNIIIYS